jgi:hypothetical protein
MQCYQKRAAAMPNESSSATAATTAAKAGQNQKESNAK